MKKSLIAVAVLAVSGASFAQSTVSIYGIADVWFGSQKITTNGDSQRQTLLNSAGVDDSRWGLKGSEDLGGGLKANFVFEQGFTVDEGSAVVGNATNNEVFSREVSVGFSGAFGAVKLGKMATPYEDVSGLSNAVFDSALSPAEYVFASTNHVERPSNSIYYQAPNFGGFSGAFSYSLGENKTTEDSASDIASLALTYDAGALALQLGYQVEDQANNNAAQNADAKYLSFGAGYDFGMVAAKFSYGKVDNVDNVSGFDATDYQVGLDFPVSSALTLSVSYAESDDKNVGFEQSREGYGIGAAYTLSKRTFVYGGYVAAKETVEGYGDDKIKLFAVGVNHRF